MNRATLNTLTISLISGCLFSTQVFADGSSNSPARKVERIKPVDVVRSLKDLKPERKLKQYRTIDGSYNNRKDPTMGAAHTQLIRLAPNTYSDGLSSMSDDSKPGPREISNALGSLPDQINTIGPSDFVWQWGQFLDHDISITENVTPAETVNIPVPEGDETFDPDSLGNRYIAFNRSLYDPSTGNSTGGPRQQINEISTWIDASNVYGSDDTRAAALRRNDGSGLLKTSKGKLLPFNKTGLPNAGGSGANLFIAGDIRANEQVGLLSLHTLFVREHNRLVKKFAKNAPKLSGEELYQKARKVVGAQMQFITYNEYLPTLLGKNALTPYKNYKAKVDARLTNEFTTALYRYGHSLVSPELKRLDSLGNESPHGHLALRDAFFRPDLLISEGGIEPILRGLASQACRDLDIKIVSDIRNFLFSNVDTRGFDLMSLNIQRGRDHGLATYNQTRLALGLIPVTEFNQISSDPAISGALEQLYSSVDEIDLWVGALAEDRYKGMVGELVYYGLKEQFENLRDGDRFWYEKYLNKNEKLELVRLSKIIKRNTKIKNAEIRSNVFKVK